MIIHAVLFANRKYDPTVVELLVAWDEYQVDENYDGFEAEIEATAKTWGDELLSMVRVDIEVPMTEVYARFEALGVKGTPTVLT